MSEFHPLVGHTLGARSNDFLIGCGNSTNVGRPLSQFCKLVCPGLLLFFGALAETWFDFGSGCADFLAHWWEWDEIPFLLFIVEGLMVRSLLNLVEDEQVCTLGLSSQAFILPHTSCGSSFQSRKSGASSA